MGTGAGEVGIVSKEISEKSRKFYGLPQRRIRRDVTERDGDVGSCQRRQGERCGC